MAERVASLRGSPIECFGSADLVRPDAAGHKRWLMHADGVLYLHPDRSRLRGPVVDVDADPLPEVVLEVDHSTDVRRRKLGIYKASGFPEIWVLVPWEASVRASGLVIHVRGEDGYTEEAASRAFPGWKAEEIHSALTETPLSETAWRALERTALAMGAREGTKPEDDPLMHSVNARAQAKGRLPVLGRLFRTDAVQEDRTELMVVVTPCVIAAQEEGWELTRRIREQLELHTELP